MRNRPILVVDGDPQSRKLVTAALTEADFEVLSAPDGSTGIELARRVQPAVIILDILTSATDGMDTLQRPERGSRSQAYSRGCHHGLIGLDVRR